MNLRARRRGALLLELLVALGLFVAIASTLLTLARQSMGGVVRATRLVEASERAASALALIEAGVETAQTLDGEQALWVDPFDEDGVGGLRRPGPSEWVLEIETSRAGYGGLTLVTVRAVFVADPGISAEVAGLVRSASEEGL